MTKREIKLEIQRRIKFHNKDLWFMSRWLNNLQVAELAELSAPRVSMYLHGLEVRDDNHIDGIESGAAELIEALEEVIQETADKKLAALLSAYLDFIN